MIGRSSFNFIYSPPVTPGSRTYPGGFSPWEFTGCDYCLWKTARFVYTYIGGTHRQYKHADICCEPTAHHQMLPTQTLSHEYIMKKNKCFIVDDDRIHVERMRRLLKGAGYAVSSQSSSQKALEEILSQPPDVVLLDMMMPGMDGLEMIRRLRADPMMSTLKIIVVSSKSYEFDRQRALAFGADDYVIKPVDSKVIIDTIRRILEDRVELTFWGVHGTLPISGPDTIRYGGNTSCVSLSFSKGQYFIFDAGSGIKVLSDQIMATGGRMKRTTIFISHPHWDHINALPFFTPLYLQGNEFEICGASHGDIDIKGLLSAQMDGVFFPIKISEFGATLSYRNLGEESFETNGIIVATMLLNHPGNCLGYRIQYRGRTVCYITDNELYPRSTPFFNAHYLERLTDFVRGADALITDSTYMDDEYPAKIHWGHSCLSEVTDLADRAEVKSLYLFHHDPNHKDDAIDLKLKQAQETLALKNSETAVFAPGDKQTFSL